MEIVTRSAQIAVNAGRDRQYLNIDSMCSGYCASLGFPQKSGGRYLCKREDTPSFLYMIVAPTDEWRKDIESDGYRIVLDLSEV
jgi:hypothetical protein